MPKRKIFFAAPALCAIFLFTLFVRPIFADNCPDPCDAHHDHYSFDNGNPGNCGAKINDWDVHGGCDGCSPPYIHDSETCKPWQSPKGWNYARATNESSCGIWNGNICSCDKDCLLAQTNQHYYDDPVNKTNTSGKNLNNDVPQITLPVLITWKDPNRPSTSRRDLGTYGEDCGYSGPYSENDSAATGCSPDDPTNFQKIPSGETKSYLVDFLVYYVADEKDTSKRLIRFDEKEPPDANDTTPPNTAGKFPIDGIGPNGQAAKILEFVIDEKNGALKQEFNSRTDGWPCFFNSDSMIYWRVRPCCDAGGQGCMTENKTPWWSFKTAGAPEPIGVTDNNHSTSASNPYPAPDPDWNGPAAIANVDFCSASLKWCSAKVDPASKQETFQQNIGHNQAVAYQMEVNYNEADTLTQFLNRPDWMLEAAKDPISFAGAIWMSKVMDPKKMCHYLLTDQSTGVCKAEIVGPHGTLQKIPATVFSNATDQNFNRGFFTKNLTYEWTLKRCFDNPNATGETCQQNVVNEKIPLISQGYGQTWSLKTITDKDPGASLNPPLLSSPPNDQKASDQNASTPVGIPPAIAWKPQCGANSFEYELDENGAQLVKKETTASQVTFVKDTPETAATRENNNVQAAIKLDTVYIWKVRSCWPSVADAGDDTKLCDSNSWAGPFSFRTTGRPPQNLKATGDNTSNIPTTFSWDPVGGAKSYILDLSPTSGTHIDKIVTTQDASKPVTIQVTYPDLKPQLTYAWKVKTCADAAGTADLCGAWSPKYSLATSNLPAPSGFVSPRDAAGLDNYPTHLAWNSVKGAVAYRITMDYTNKDTDAECQKSGRLFDSVTTTNSYNPAGLPVACLGSYAWNVATCFSENCAPAETGGAATWTFSIAKGGGKDSGFMVCGLRDDDTKTPWDERNPCQFGDLFKLLEKLIDFALFKLSFWLLPILVAITGGLFYTHAGGTDTLKMIKQSWIRIGIGYALLFFAWLLTNWTLQAFGYHGLWWKIL